MPQREQQYWPQGTTIGHTLSRSGVGLDPPFGGTPVLQRKKLDPSFNPMTMEQKEASRANLGMTLPTPDFSPQARYPTQARAQMPQAPEARIQMPTYERPEPMGWKKALLGIGLSGGAQLQGMGAQTADAFFREPERRAEADYARELGAYSARQGEWSDYFDDMMAADKFNLSAEELEEQKRANQVEETAPFAVARGAGVWDPVARKMIYEDTNLFGGGSQWEFQANEAYNYWLENNPGRTKEDMTALDRDQAITQFRRRRGLETSVPGFDADGGLINVPRSDSYYEERPANRFDEFGNIIYQGPQRSTGTRDRVAQITAEDIARIDQWASDQKRLARRNYENNKNAFFAPLPGTESETEAEAALEAELVEIDREAGQRKERLRSGTIEPGPGEGRVLEYNPATGRAE